jgi:hypothetical protein
MFCDGLPRVRNDLFFKPLAMIQVEGSSHYLYDIFISYKRHPEWDNWVQEHIRNLLDTYLTQELARAPEIFIDDKIEIGSDWPEQLGRNLGGAKILIPILSKDYFASDWCIHELDLMHGRLLRHPECRIIIPLIRHDGDMIPSEINRIKSYDIKKFGNPDIQRRTPRYEQFSDVIGEIAPLIANAIQQAPTYNSAWQAECTCRFDSLYRARTGSGDKPDVATLTLKTSLSNLSPPRGVL